MKTRMLWGFGVVALLAVFACHYQILNGGFWSEDEYFLGTKTEPGFIGYDARIHSLPDVICFFDVNRGWFFRPLFLLYMGVGQLIWGNNALAYHAASLCLHAANLFLVTLLAWRFTKNKTACLWAFSLFLLWPNTFQALAWIASTSTLWASLAVLVAMHLWLSFQTSGRWVFYFGALAAFGIGLLFKSEAFITIPALAALALHLDNKIPARVAIPCLLPFVAVLAVFLKVESIATAVFQSLPGNSPLLAQSSGVMEKAAVVWGGLPFFALLFGFSAWPLWFAGIVLAARRSNPQAVKICFALCAVGILYALALMWQVGGYVVATRFVYIPSLFLAVGLSMIFASLKIETLANYAVGYILTAGLCGGYESLMGKLEIPGLVFAVCVAGAFVASRLIKSELLKPAALALVPCFVGASASSEGAPIWAAVCLCACAYCAYKATPETAAQVVRA